MVASPFPRKRSKPRPDGPTRFVLAHLEGAAPATDIALIEAVEGLQVVNRSDQLLLVTGPVRVADLKAALPSLKKRWTFAKETFMYMQKS